jgi:predicted transcriptional regulator
MPKAKESGLEKPSVPPDEEDTETLDAIDEGLRDAQAGRTVPIDEARKLVPLWTTKSSSRKGR